MFGFINLVDKAFWPPLRHSSADLHCPNFENYKHYQILDLLRVRRLPLLVFFFI